MRRAGMAVLVIGLVLTFGSCAVLFPGQSGSDYAAINGAGPIGTLVGIALTFVGAAMVGSAVAPTQS